MNLEVASPVVVDRLELLHREMPWITLSDSAAVPLAGADMPAGERQRLLQDLVGCERTLMVATSLVRRRESAAAAIEPREVRDGWRKFFVSHAAFFHVFALLADCYREATTALAAGDWPLREIQRASALWRLAGALMLYGVDFSPTEEIYQGYIRPQMPEAFSGTWLREYALVTESRRAFDRALEARAGAHREVVRDLKSGLAEGEKCYHTYHFQVMLACVPDLTSKLQEYQVEHGKLSREDRHYQIYDAWFHVLRLPGIDLASYVRSVCAVFSELLADVVAGTFLAPEPLAALTGGMATVLEMLRAAVGAERLHEA